MSKGMGYPYPHPQHSQFGEVIGEFISRDSDVSLHPGKPNQSLRQAKFIFYGNYKFRSRPVALEGLDGRPNISVNIDFLFIFNSPIHCLTQSRKFGLEDSVSGFQFFTYNFMLNFSMENAHREPNTTIALVWFGEGSASSSVVLLISPWLKITRSIPK
ncbi:hypothetical protein AVEN_61947-1 [Araneus ventricosus]|uniref:Uncharacterized protein n=1 Tax=Araneus ventricosus TaxID=182803 RepID=A0A4Y2MTQ3_ARAVE|nr:hypothetical protein AVEN_61947-1 [Araneus ventricosus]